MTKTPAPGGRPDYVAAALAWLVPGVGHFYQGRNARGIVFFVLLVGSFLYGMYLGDGDVVYFKWDDDEKRLQYFAQIGAGALAVPGVMQWWSAGGKNAQLSAIWQRRRDLEDRKQLSHPAWCFGQFQPPPDQIELDRRHNALGRWIDLGTLYTMTAGFLNLLVIYDALLGPALVAAAES